MNVKRQQTRALLSSNFLSQKVRKLILKSWVKEKWACSNCSNNKTFDLVEGMNVMAELTDGLIEFHWNFQSEREKSG